MSQIKSLAAKAVLVVTLLCLATANAFADFTFDIAESTTGQFYLGSLPLGASLAGLSFIGTSFGQNGQTVAPGAEIAVDPGSLSLATLLSYYDPFDFKRSVNFTAPSIAGTLFEADLSGLVTMFGGSARDNFDNGPRHFAFTGPQGSGSFDLFVTDVKVTDFSTASIKDKKGKVKHIAASPEPAAILLTSAFIAGVIVLFRKRLANC